MALAVLLLLAGPPARAGEAYSSGATEDEYRVKAAFLFNFIRYTTWPADSFEDERAPILVLVVGEDPFGPHLKAALAKKQVAGRAIRVLHSPEVPPQVGAHVVFAGHLGKADNERLLDLCRGEPVLLIGERPGFAAAGAQVNFYLEKANVRFEINVDALAASKLEVSSQLKKLARIVRGPGDAGR